MSHNIYQIVDLMSAGKALEAFETYYGEGVSMRENENQPTVGKEANRDREIAFFDSIAEVHDFSHGEIIAAGDHSAVRWNIDYTTKDGKRLAWKQWAVQTWKDGKVVDEQFVYDTASVKVA